jgi:hypothetical protein
LPSGSKPAKKSARRKVEQKAPTLKKSTITCPCGVQILLVPDVKEMNLALEKHVSEHKKNYKISDVEAEVILDNLIAQVLSKISQEF